MASISTTDRKIASPESRPASGSAVAIPAGRATQIKTTLTTASVLPTSIIKADNLTIDRLVSPTPSLEIATPTDRKPQVRSMQMDVSKAEETDPAIKSFNEIAQPLARGYAVTQSGLKRKTEDKWFKRIFGELKLFRKEETVFNKAANRSLKNIGDKPVVESSGSTNLFMWAGIAAAIIKSIMKHLPKVIAAAMVLLRRLPVVGALISSARNIDDINEGNTARGVGGIAGTFAGLYGGAKLGAAVGSVGGPLGAAVGGLVGGSLGMYFGDDLGRIAGEKIGAWIDELRNSDLPGQIVDAISSGFASLFEGVNGFFKEKIGIDLESKFKPVIDAGKKVLSKIGTAIEPISDAAKRAFESGEVVGGSMMEKALPKGYRHRASFEGVEGGNSLAKYGTYTDAEAQRIRALKTSSANTSANMRDGMPVEIQEKIAQQARMHGLDPAMMLKFAAMESGGNPNAISKTGAIGLFQLTGQTASGLGVKNRFDVDENIKGAIALTKQNIAFLENHGLPVTEGNLYMMHQLDPKSAKEIIEGAAKGKSKNELSPRAQKSMNLNYGANSKTAEDYIAVNKRALEDRFNSAVTVTPSSNVVSMKAVASPQVVSVKTPAVPHISFPSAITEAPSVITPLASGNDRKLTVISPIQQDVGQDVKDRRIANIVTGGLGGN